MEQKGNEAAKSLSNVASSSGESSQTPGNVDPIPSSTLNTEAPPKVPSQEPSKVLSKTPSPAPSKVLSKTPSPVPSKVLSKSPSPVPSKALSKSPSPVPSKALSKLPSQVPSKTPSQEPSKVLSKSPSPVPSNTPSQDKVLSTSSSQQPSNALLKVPSQVQEEAVETLDSPNPIPSSIGTGERSGAIEITPSQTKSLTAKEEGNMIGEKDGDWILEKMGGSGSGSGKGRKGASGGRNGKGGENRGGKGGDKCSLDTDFPTDLDPDRTGEWVLDKMFRQTNPPCKAEASVSTITGSVVPSQARLNGNALGNDGTQYVNMNEPSNLYEKDGNWVLEKMGSSMGFGAMTKTNRKQNGEQSDKSKCEGGGTMSDGIPGCFNKKKVCELARNCLVAYDTLTSCDIMGKNECDIVEDNGESLFTWISDILDVMFAHSQPSEPTTTDTITDTGPDTTENNNCS